MKRSNATSRISILVALLLSGLLSVLAPVTAEEDGPMPGQRVILVTGSTGGLGRETALALAAAGDHVILHGRNVERAEEVLAEIRAGGNGSASFYRADLASLAETRRLADSILADYDRLDVLVNNAGVFLPDGNERRLTGDGYELHFQVNYLAGFILTAKLRPLLAASAPSRIINVASGQRPLDFDDLMLDQGYTGTEAYFRSKNAQIMMAFALADELAEQGITINAMHPSSLMNTDMVIEAGFEPKSSVETGRDALLRLINDDVGTGKFFNVFKEDDVITEAYDEDAQQRLLAVTEELVSKGL
ncbi:MAG: SDR family NAD(P)-dependent oxidoreductase [Pseudomonadota bacterium]